MDYSFLAPSSGTFCCISITQIIRGQLNHLLLFSSWSMSDPGRKSEILEDERIRKVGNSGSDIQSIPCRALGYQFYVREPRINWCLTHLPVSFVLQYLRFLNVGRTIDRPITVS